MPGYAENKESVHGKATVVLHTGGIYRGSENAVVEKALGSRPGVLAVEANPVAQTANVT